MSELRGHRATLSIATLRNLILAALVVGITAFTLVMQNVTDGLARRFGPEVRIDLEWRAIRGAQELARACDVGLAVADAQLVQSAFGVYAKSTDVLAIVAVDAEDKPVGVHGKTPEGPERLFVGEPGKLREGSGYLVSWAPSVIEGATIGKVALVISTRRLREANALLERSSDTTLVSGCAALLLGGLVVAFFTRAVAQRDSQLSDYAVNLERKVDERTRELDARNRGMRLVLDNVAQGFVTIDTHGQMASERSAIVDRWFGTPPEQATLMSYLGERAPQFAQWLVIGLEQLRDGFMPVDLVLDQMPKSLSVEARTYEVSYTPILAGEAVEQLLVIISDVTESLARTRSEREQRELVGFFQRISVDRGGVEDFLAEAAGLVAALRKEEDPTTQKRLVHTLKGNCAIYGLESYAELAHRIEDELAETGAGITPEQRHQLTDVWKQAMVRVGWLLGSGHRDTLEVDRVELNQLINRVTAAAPSAHVLATLRNWQREPVAAPFERLGRQARALAQRLGKPEPTIVIKGGDVRLAPKLWSPYWSAMVHVVRNAVDHGVEDLEERCMRRKPEAATLIFEAERSQGQVIFSVSDDGRGIDWEKVRSKAGALGLATATSADLVEALFQDGLSTRDQLSSTSGRGVGLSALRAQVLALHGEIEVKSTPDVGTTFRFRFDEEKAEQAALRLPRVSLHSLMPRTA